VVGGVNRLLALQARYLTHGRPSGENESPGLLVSRSPRRPPPNHVVVVWWGPPRRPGDSETRRLMITQHITTSWIRSEADDIPRLQYDAVDARIVDIGSVGGLKIFKQRGGSAEGDSGVAARDGGVAEHDRAGAVAADHHGVAGDGVLLVRLRLHVHQRPLSRAVGARRHLRGLDH